MPIPTYGVPPQTPTNAFWAYLMFCTTATGAANLTMMPYIVSGDPLPGSDPDDYLYALSVTVADAIIPWLSSDSGVDGVGFYWQTSRGLQSWIGSPFGGFIPGVQPAPSMPNQVNGFATKITARYPMGKPRMYIPNPPQSDVFTDGWLSSAAFARLIDVVTAWVTPIITHGVTFTPASLNRAANVLEPITGARVHRRTYNLMRRSPHRMNQTFLMPQIWTW